MLRLGMRNYVLFGSVALLSVGLSLFLDSRGKESSFASQSPARDFAKDLGRQPAAQADFLAARTVQADPKDRFVHLMHLDGFHSEAFSKMLQAGQLPHFKFMVEHGRLSTRASTVDKSETMKVIPAVMSSRVDTRIAGWWQFDRSQMAFSNFWLDPVEVVNYALGLDFPLYPTMLDVMARDQQPVVAGFSLFRRGVPFDNYSRIYLEGIDAAFSHRYFNQADATMKNLLEMIKAKAQAGTPPRLTTSLVAAVDEMIHLNGITTSEVSNGVPKRHCLTRTGATSGHDAIDDAFDVIQTHLRARDGIVFTDRTYEERRIRAGQNLGQIYDVRFASGRLTRFCYNIPSVKIRESETVTRELYLYPEVALAYLMVDMLLGRLIDGLREIPIGAPQIAGSPARGLEAYLAKGQLEGSLFEKTLFLFYGDHGMVNTFHEMNEPMGIPAEAINRSPESINKPFARILAEGLGISVFVKDQKIGQSDDLIVDYQNLPPRLSKPNLNALWQDGPTQTRTQNAKIWAEQFFEQTRNAVRDSAYRQYWWLTILRGWIVDPKVNSTLAPIRDQAIQMLSATYLRGDETYRQAELSANREFYNENVKIVYGGGALNNAEFFLPVYRNGKRTWGPRPNFSEINSAFDGQFLSKLKATPGIGLIFVRRQNELFATDAAPPRRMEVLVLDTKGGQAIITVTLDPSTKEKVYHYRVPNGSTDPLGYGTLGQGAGTFGTYAQWNQRSIEANHIFHNVVAGMGSYLYSTSPAIGDVTAMHAIGWNFGENLGGHGGVEAGEKLTVMLMSGPGVQPGELMSQALFSANTTGRVEQRPYVTHPTVLDIAPTTLQYLGYATQDGEGELTRFARNGFREYLQNWTASQKTSCPNDGTRLIAQLAEEKGINFSASYQDYLRRELGRLCEFVGTTPFQLPNYQGTKEDGNLLLSR